MAQLIVSEFLSVDGVMEDPGGAESSERGGWALGIDRGKEGDTFKLEETMQSDALLLGRVTYEGFAAAWPAREGEFADRFNSLPKYVVSSTLSSPEWNNTIVLTGRAAESVSQLSDELDGTIVVHGSGQLVRTLLEHDLVDELRLMVFPILLGGGKRLFGASARSACNSSTPALWATES